MPLLSTVAKQLQHTTEKEAKSLHAWDDGGRLERKLGNIGQGEFLEDVYKLRMVTCR